MFRKKWYASSVRTLAFVPGGRSLAVVRDRPKESNTYDLDLFDVETGQHQKEIVCGFWAGVRPIAFTHDGRSLYTIGHQDAVVKVWDLATGAGRQLFAALKPPPEPVDAKKEKPFASDVAFSPDLMTLITSQGRELIVWDIARGEAIAAFPSDGTHHGGNIALSNDGHRLAMTDLNYAGDPGSNDLRLFDIKSQRLITAFHPGQSRASSFAFSPDSTRLVTGMSDGTALVWDLATARDARNQ